ncbi:MAG: oligosaccharide flippase family protein [Prevotella sp.]|nr:oligosaccharide flippase family protein [Prevotella sp.]
MIPRFKEEIVEKTDKTKGYSHILKYTGLFGGVQGLNILVGIIRNKLVAVILGPSGMGLISLFNSTINLIANSTNLGIPISAVKNISEASAREDRAALEHLVVTVRSWCLLTALAGVVLCIALSSLLSYWTFGWGNHTLHFILLSPVVGMLAVTGGEMAILKGMRRLRPLALVSVWHVLLALIITVPLYYFFGEAAIVPSLLVMALVQMLLTLVFSLRLFPLRFKGGSRQLSEGAGMVRLGIAFVIAGILGSGAEFLIRSFLSYSASLETVGLYTAGYMMIMTYASVVFSSMESDFFPRLSANHQYATTANTVVNRQIEVSLLIVSPLLVFFTIAMPILLPLLYSGKFSPAIGMMQVMAIAVYFRAIKLPMAYLPLAKGDSYSYLLLEAIYDILLVVAVVVAFRWWGLTGCGIAITAVGILDFLVILLYTGHRYGYHISAQVIRYAAIQIPFGLLAYLVTFVHQPWLYWTLGIALGMTSMAVSLHILRQKTNLWESLTAKVRRRLGRG